MDKDKLRKISWTEENREYPYGDDECINCKGEGVVLIEGSWCKCPKCSGTGDRPNLPDMYISKVGYFHNWVIDVLPYGDECYGYKKTYQYAAAETEEGKMILIPMNSIKFID